MVVSLDQCCIRYTLLICQLQHQPSQPRILMIQRSQRSVNTLQQRQPISSSRLDSRQVWLNKWRIKINESKQTHVSMSHILYLETLAHKLSNKQLIQEASAKYLCIHLDRHFTQRKPIFMKRKQLGLQFSKLQWLLGRRCKLSLQNKLLIYKVT